VALGIKLAVRDDVCAGQLVQRNCLASAQGVDGERAQICDDQTVFAWRSVLLWCGVAFAADRIGNL
jgi:hypothetical protein